MALRAFVKLTLLYHLSSVCGAMNSNYLQDHDEINRNISKPSHIIVNFNETKQPFDTEIIPSRLNDSFDPIFSNGNSDNTDSVSKKWRIHYSTPTNRVSRSVHESTSRRTVNQNGKVDCKYFCITI